MNDIVTILLQNLDIGEDKQVSIGHINKIQEKQLQ